MAPLGLVLFLFQKVTKLFILMEKHFKESAQVEQVVISMTLKQEKNIGFQV